MKAFALFISILFTVAAHANTDKYRIIITDDPSSTITIAWNQMSGEEGKVYYDTIDHSIDTTAYNNQMSVYRAVEYRGMNNQFVKLTGLSPNTAYYFVVKDSESLSQRFWFKTAPNDKSRLSFVAGGDSRNNRSVNQLANLLVSKLKPHVVLFGGDMTDDDSDEEWRNWMDDWQNTTSPDGRMIPIIPTRGNHDNYTVIHHLFDTVSKDSYGAVTFGDEMIRVYTLNTEISITGNQTTWLKNDLDNNTAPIWRMAQYHTPMRPHHSGKPEGHQTYKSWAQLFFEKRMNLVVECDSHVAKTTWPIVPSIDNNSYEGFVINKSSGTVYTGEGCWGAPLRTNNDDKPWTRSSGVFNQFKLIFISKDKIELRTIKVDNAEAVAMVSNEDSFILPDSLDIWKPANGAVVEIMYTPELEFPSIKFSNNTIYNYSSGEDISLDIDVVKYGIGIDYVSFYVDGEFVHSDNSEPFSFTHDYENNDDYNIEAVAYTLDSLTTGTKTILNIGKYSRTKFSKIIQGPDDVEESSSGSINYTSSDLEFVYDGSKGYQTIGMRFQDIKIPVGAIVDMAYIQFRSDEVNDQYSEYNIHIEDTGNSKPINSDLYNISNRNLCDNPVYWTPKPWSKKDDSGPDQRTDSLTRILQLVVDRDDWKQGNSILIALKGTGESATNFSSKRVADSYEGSKDFAPKLLYHYTFDGTNMYNNTTDIIDDSKIQVFPNPISNKISISFNKPHTDIKINIVDIKGNLIYKNINKGTIDKLEFFPNIDNTGLYYLSIYSNDNKLIKTKKIIVSK